ncbi:MAG: DUF1614 domain-containing protein [Candidatus Fermentithermobacillus carboniphilus]|uniref:DUF1614 domain-containing protein n=1 Tax=Candidatus Fermentithermobacillus carboniphilus TaxID=3085328 RepID=A0AAT9LCS5_9FIRM|nr:MAG: DUF1614 domain-containing protein [Candidatus Fermentithermobacillus carboniphilus]
MGLPIGTVILIIVAILIFFGVLHRVLDRMRLTDRAALAIIVAMAAGTFVDFTLLRTPVTVRVNVGGGIIPVIVAVWLIGTADETHEKARAIMSAIVTGAVVWGLSKVLSPEEQWMRVTPMLIYGIAAGIIAALAGRSRRAAFVGGLGGIVLADIFHWIELAVMRIPGTVFFGGAGAFDAAVISSILAVGLVEVVGEAREKAVKPRGGGSDENAGQ